MKPRYKVTAELTPFFDRWGSEHYRILYEGNWLLIAIYKVWLHEVANPPYGIAWITKRSKKNGSA